MDTLIKRIEVLAKEQPEKAALAFKNQIVSYRKLADRMRNVASRMTEMGITKGDRVMFSAVSKPEMAVLYLATQYIGGIAVFVDKNITPNKAIEMYEDSGARVFFTDKPLKGYEEKCNVYSLKKAYNECGKTLAEYCIPNENDIAELIYTSGTTGIAKGCMLTYKAIRSIWNNTIDGIGITGDDITLIPLPLNHSFALRVLRSCLYMGATVVLQNGFTFAKEIENNLERFACTSIAIVPASVETIAKQMQDKFPEIMGRFKYIEVSAGALTTEQRKRLVAQLPNTIIHNTWGSSETGGVLFLNVTDTVHNRLDKIATLGKPISGAEIKTIDDKGNSIESDPSHPGRMAIKGDMNMIGYWNKPELSEHTIIDGWLVTGDMIYEDKDGYLYMLGRADDIINVGGEKVSPIEVENVASEYEGVSECACIGVEDPNGVLGSVPVLFYVVSKNNNCDKDELRQFLSQKLERYKVPEYFFELIALPRNAMQKIDRAALKMIWESRDNRLPLTETIKTILTRRSIRKFTDRKIEKEILCTIVKTGYYAPSGHNMQTWKFTVITAEEELRELKRAAKEAADSNKVHFYGWENPAAIVLVSNDRRNADGCQDASCASENMMVSAWSLGIGSVWLNPLMTLRNEEPVKSLLDRYEIPKNHTVWSAIAMGYPVTEGVKLKKNEEVVTWIE